MQIKIIERTTDDSSESVFDVMILYLLILRHYQKPITRSLDLGHWGRFLCFGGIEAKQQYNSVLGQRCDILSSQAIRHKVNFCSLFNWSFGGPLTGICTSKHTQNLLFA